MKPPYIITPKILQLVAAISERIGTINAVHLAKPATELRKKNRIKTIQSSLEIEGNTLTEEQVTALLENRRVLAPEKDIIEVQNAIAVYKQLANFNPNLLKDMLRAHKMLMNKLISSAGKLRKSNVGIVKGSVVKHVAPAGNIVMGLMNELFDYLKNDDDLLLIKSCVFHYELEFIHPFVDGNGRMGRLWQTLLLMQQYPVMEYLPVEHLIKLQQMQYYQALAKADKKGSSTPFVEFMLGILLEALNQLVGAKNVSLNSTNRMQLFMEKIGDQIFSRKQYLQYFKNISAPTASRDLKYALESGILKKQGNKRVTEYWFE
jgi:Fic family protein